jgi:O-antigen ligase
LLPVVAALAAILILPWWSFSFDIVPKVVVILAGAALVCLVPRKRPDFRGDPATGPLRWFAMIAAAQAIVIIAAAIFSTHPRLSWSGGIWRRSGAIAVIAVLVLAVAGAAQLAADKRALRMLLRVTVLASLPISIYGILQYFGVDPLLSPAGYHFGEGSFMIVRPPSTLGHAAYFATYLLYVAFAGAAMLTGETARTWRTAAIAASILAIFAIVLSGTRAAMLGFVLGASFVVLRERINWRFIAAIAVLLAGLAAFYFTPAGERLRARAFWASEDPLGGSRLLLWRDSLRMASARWVLGYGPETFAIDFPQHESLALARAYPDFYHESPHNIFLDALDATGIFGLIALVALVALCLARAARARGPIGGAFVAMLASLQFTTFTLTTELYFYLVAAMLVTDFANEAAVVSRLALPRWSALFAIPFLGMAVYLATGDALLAAARNALDHGVLDSKAPNRAARLEDRARGWNVAADVYFSRRFLALNANQPPADAVARFRIWQYAMAAASHASDTAEDRQNALLNLAALESSTNDASAVERTLREAILAAPMYYKSHWLLAQVLELEGRTAEARTEAQAAVARDGGKHPEVAATLERLDQRLRPR